MNQSPIIAFIVKPVPRVSSGTINRKQEDLMTNVSSVKMVKQRWKRALQKRVNA